MRAPTIPFCQTVSQYRLCASRALEAQSVPVPCKNLRAAGCSKKKNESFWRSRKMDPSLPTKLHRGRLSPAVCKGAGGFGQSPWDPQKRKKKGLDPVACERASDLEDDPVLTRGISKRICSVDWFHIRGRYLTAQDVIPTRDYQRHQWLVVNRELLESSRRSY